MNRNAGDVLEDAHLERCGLAAEGRRDFRRASTADFQINLTVLRNADKRGNVRVAGVPINVRNIAEHRICCCCNRDCLANCRIDIRVFIIVALCKNLSPCFECQHRGTACQYVKFLCDRLM